MKDLPQAQDAGQYLLKPESPQEMALASLPPSRRLRMPACSRSIKDIKNPPAGYSLTLQDKSNNLCKMQIQIPALACGLLASLVFANSNDNKPKFTIEISGNDDPECYFQTEDFCVSAPGGSSTDPRTQSEPFGKYDKSTETCTCESFQGCPCWE